MRLRDFARVGVFAASLAIAATAQAAVIQGPVLNEFDGGYTTSGLGFTALNSSDLTSFTFQNQGAADTIVLTDSAGNILDSVTTPANATSDVVSVSWALASGGTYWLLQTSDSNSLYTDYDSPLPSDKDISIIQSGTFGNDIGDALSNASGIGANDYWVAFNNITTSSVPEPATWAMMLVGVGCLGAARRSRRKVIRSAA